MKKNGKATSTGNSFEKFCLEESREMSNSTSIYSITARLMKSSEMHYGGSKST